MSDWPLVALCALLGVLAGSFAAVAIHRWPRKIGLLPGVSRCAQCGERVHVFWLLLGGRCRRCLEPTSWLVQLLVAVVWGLIAFVHGPVGELPALLAVGWAVVVATVIDLEFRIIPNKLTYRLAPIVLGLLVAAAAFDDAWGDFRRAVVAGIALPLGMLLLSEAFRLVRGQPGMGMGDVKLAASLGLVLGYIGGWEVVIAIYAAVIAAVVVASVLIVAGRAGLATRLPFGPYLALGTLVAVLAGTPLTVAIRTWLGLA
ncbi:MAG: A24 family peptidase [Nitriliruptorales bacterium]